MGMQTEQLELKTDTILTEINSSKQLSKISLEKSDFHTVIQVIFLLFLYAKVENI
jgi:hypothetical protein